MRVGIKASAYNWNMRRAREEKGLTQSKLAEILGVHQSYIGEIELLKGKNGKFDFDKFKSILEQIADVLEKPFDYLFPPDYLMALTGNRLPKKMIIDLFFDKDINKLPSQEIPLLENPIEIIETDSLVSDIKKALYLLPDRERNILEYRYGVNDGQEKTCEDVAVHFGITRERVRQLEAQGLSKLRHPSISRKLRDYTYS